MENSSVTQCKWAFESRDNQLLLLSRPASLSRDIFAHIFVPSLRGPNLLHSGRDVPSSETRTDSILPQILPICELNRECCCFRIRSFGNFRRFHRSAILRSKMSKDYEDEYEVRRLKFHRRKISELYDRGRREFPKSQKRPWLSTTCTSPRYSRNSKFLSKPESSRS